jgi:hypothetical protein
MNPAREVKTERFSRAEGKTPSFDTEQVQKVRSGREPQDRGTTSKWLFELRSRLSGWAMGVKFNSTGSAFIAGSGVRKSPSKRVIRPSCAFEFQ